MELAGRRAAQTRRAAADRVEHPGPGRGAWLGALGRQKLVDTIRDTGAKGVVLLSGDRHVGALYRETPPGLPPLYEITSSGLNMVFWQANEPGPNRLGALYPAANFGVVDIDWREQKVQLALRDEGGTTRRSVVLNFSDLGITG